MAKQSSKKHKHSNHTIDNVVTKGLLAQVRFLSKDAFFEGSAPFGKQQGTSSSD